MFSFRIIEEFDIIEHVLASIFAGGVRFPPDPLSFQKLEKAFRNGVVVAISPAAHTGFQIMGLEKIATLNS